MACWIMSGKSDRKKLMIITKTPFRMSFFGGGTDMESFFREHGGAVLSTTFDKYCYVKRMFKRYIVDDMKIFWLAWKYKED